MELIIYTLITLGLGMSIGHMERIKDLKRPLGVKIVSFIVYFILLLLFAKFLGVD